MNTNELKALGKNEIPTISKSLNGADVNFLIQTLDEKDDKIRYNAFLLLQAHSREQPIVYEHWNELESKLESTNSYQRSIGAMLIAENVKWDKDNRFSKTISKYLNCCNDEKFITARQTIQGFESILKTTGKFDNEIRQRLASLKLSLYKENQQKLIHKDISRILKIMENQ